MHATIDDMKAIDPGLLLRLHGVKAELDQIRQKCGTAPIDTTQIYSRVGRGSGIDIRV